MNKTPPSHYRSSAAEMTLQHQIYELRQNLEQLIHSVRAVIPSVTVNLNWAPSNFPDEIPHRSMLDGRGPRFIAKYHLAESDQERQALLDSLPKVPNGNTTFWSDLARLTAEYRSVPHREYSVNIDAFEYTNWLSKKLFNLEHLPEFQGSTNILDLVNDFIEYNVLSNGDVVIPHDFINLRFIPPPTIVPERWNSPSTTVPSEPVYLTIIGVPEMMGFAVIEHVPVARSSSISQWRYTPRFCQCLIWNRHELCWNVTDHKGVHVDFNELVTRRLLKEIGMPYLNLVDIEEMADVYGALADHIKSNASMWYDDIICYTPKFQERTVRLDGVLKLTFREDTWNYTNTSAMITFLDDEADLLNFPAMLRFDKIGNKEPYYALNKHNHRASGPKVSVYQDRRIIDLIKQFLAAPLDDLVIETIPSD
jgi:hypothetical protein